VPDSSSSLTAVRHFEQAGFNQISITTPP
jgi:hypothetical protein